MSNDFPKFTNDRNGHVTMLFSNFTGEVTVKEIIGVKKYVDIPIPKQKSKASSEHSSEPSSPRIDDSAVDTSRNLLDESVDADPPADDESASSKVPADNDESIDDDDVTVDLGLPFQRFNVSAALDDDVEIEQELSQQVRGYQLRNRS